MGEGRDDRRSRPSSRISNSDERRALSKWKRGERKSKGVNYHKKSSEGYSRREAVCGPTRSRSRSRGGSGSRGSSQEHWSQSSRRKRDPKGRNPLKPLAATPSAQSWTSLLGLTARSSAESWPRNHTAPSGGGKAAFKRCCRYYDVKGVGVHDELCLFDDGNESVTVDDGASPAISPSRPRSSMSLPPITALPVGIWTPVTPRNQPLLPDPFPRSEVHVCSHISKHNSRQKSGRRPLETTLRFPLKKLWMDRQNFSNGHMDRHQKHLCANAKLEVCGIPRDLNNVKKLNEHFSKFGTVVSIEVMFGGDPGAALIKYAANEEARRAISSTEAVLNSYFIGLRWHQEDGERLFLPPRHNAPAPGSSSFVQVTSESAGKTVKAQKAMKRKQDTLKLHQYRTRKKREMLEIQIKCQKALINKLQKNKDMTPEERAGVVNTFKELMDKISLLKEELKQAAKANAADVSANPRGCGRSTMGQSGSNPMVVDRRPRALAVAGVTEEERVELTAHFMQFGEMEELRAHDAANIVMIFKTRTEAEKALNQGALFKNRMLHLSWYKPESAAMATVPRAEASKEEESIRSTWFTEEDEEEDEDDDKNESRSWRR